MFLHAAQEKVFPQDIQVTDFQCFEERSLFSSTCSSDTCASRHITCSSWLWLLTDKEISFQSQFSHKKRFNQDSGTVSPSLLITQPTFIYYDSTPCSCMPPRKISFIISEPLTEEIIILIPLIVCFISHLQKNDSWPKLKVAAGSEMEPWEDGVISCDYFKAGCVKNSKRLSASA